MSDVAIVADDLSGACEAAATFLLRTTRISIALDAVAGSADGFRVVAVDTHSRGLAPAQAAGRVMAAIAGRAGVPVLKKVDSLLRGNIAAEVTALRDLLRTAPVVATALPAAGRTVVGGVPHVGGTPLHATALWHAEPGAAPRTVADALAPMATVTVPLAVVRGGADGLARALGAAVAGSLVPVCDAETDADLDAIHAAVALLPTPPVLVGSAGLVAAAARAMPADPAGPLAVDRRPPAADAVLVVAGTCAPSLAGQLDVLAPEADAVVRLDPHALLTDPVGTGRELTARLAGARCVAVSLDGSGDVDAGLSARLARALAEAVAPTAGDGRALILTGGETARAVLDRLGVDRLRPAYGCEGAVVSTTGTGRVVATRPGSFGGPASLAGLVRTVLSHPKDPKEPA
ncbi:four-carbon acid sugar kinase family protein [Dactylosporangium sp. NPDC005572]|uniref:four-carbon acid sugar kinase family protein n=1 Tax=Dactylosporangium sp. NPDC005572 TaxID=3156889 RepID=UPI0033A17CF2